MCWRSKQAINAAETVVDEMAYELLAKEQPMAIDLRFILSVIKINGDLERIGDQAANIAERAHGVEGRSRRSSFRSTSRRWASASES